MEKYGFVYIWKDKKHKRYYIGSHWGHEKDGYICSSKWMRRSFYRRSEDFKRRTLKRNIARDNLLKEEQRWLDMIKPEEVKVRYYNISLTVLNNVWWNDEWSRKTIGQKISNYRTGKKYGKRSPEIGRKISKTLKELGHKPIRHDTFGMLGKKHSEETKIKMSLAAIGKPKSLEHIENSRNARIGMKFGPASEERKRKIGDANRGKTRRVGWKHSEETKIKISIATKGKPKIFTKRRYYEKL